MDEDRLEGAAKQPKGILDRFGDAAAPDVVARDTDGRAPHATSARPLPAVGCLPSRHGMASRPRSRAALRHPERRRVGRRYRGDYTVAELAQRCAEAAPDFCYGYIIGSGQLYQQITRVGVVRGWACADPLPTLEQVRQVFVDWAGAHPTMANGAAVNGFWQAMSEHWPCKGK